MNGTRGILYFVGVVLVLIALWMFFFQSGLNRWVPAGIALAAVILIIGVSVMSFAENTPSDEHGDVHREGDVNITERNVDTRRRTD